MAKYKAYPEYKDSGVEWLGKIPIHWIRSKFGYLKTILTDYTANGSFADLKSNVTYLDEPSYARLVRLTDLRHDLNNSNGVWIDKNSYNYLGKSSLYGGEFLLANVGAYAGLFYQMPYKKGPASLAPNMFMAKFSPEKISRKFIAYVGQADNISKQLMLKATASSAQPKLNKDDFKSIFCCYPPLNEQTKISVFLDHETAKIDNLIEKQQQLIELLKEKRQAVISHAVTKGLNPDVPMKDSGIEWLGPISQHCIITKLKYLTVLKTEKAVSNNIRYVGMENISSGTGKFLSKDEMTPEGASVSFEYNDVLFGKLRPYLAKSWLATFAGICSSEFLVLQPKKIHARYLNYYLLTNEFIKQVDSSTYGSKMPRANWDFISQLPVPTWTYEESKAIAVYLDNLTAKLDCLLEKQNQQVNLLQERRTALISAAVTGKIDVRDWVAPDKQDVEEPQEAIA
ncbi:restriction endonuclease subunit S [Citrobacter amalonaticus]|nr:restriction endonuclease subunit S [Citrobacter amalonaticus]